MKIQHWRLTQEKSGLSPIDFAVLVYKERNRQPPEDMSVEDKRRFYATKRFKPLGFTTKGMGYWYPLPHECRTCCTEMEHPPPSWPWGYKTHCKTARHIAHLFGVDEKELARVLGMGIRPRCANCSRFRKEDDYICGYCRKVLAENNPAC